MKIAVSSQNFRTVTAHAGKARRFIVFDLATPCAPREVERLELPRELALHEYRGLDHPLFAMDAVITAGAGDGFVRRLGARGIEVVLTGETDPLQAVHDYVAGIVKPPLPHEHGHGHGHEHRHGHEHGHAHAQGHAHDESR
ncbi:MAG TPA: nitrogen fixation protein [Thauera phenylacetica]|jgi:predicted Fe-Mo cluster-binding NifX family protein|nr:nitrogen fixation protein [Thauera phenylacetica]